MPPFLETILYVFALAGLGYGAAASGMLKQEVGDGLSTFVFSVAAPVLLFRTMVTAEFGERIPYELWGVYFLAVAVTWVCAHLMIRHAFGRDTRSGVVSGVTAGYGNLVMLGIPFIGGVFGEAGLAYLSLLISVHTAVMLAVCIVLFEWAIQKDGKAEAPTRLSTLARQFTDQLLTNPLILGIVAGVAWRLIGLPLPSLAARLVDSIAGVAPPIALIAMGMSLARLGIRGHLAPAVGLAGLKLFLLPALVLAFSLAAGLDPFMAKVAVACAALPAGVNSWLIAGLFSTGQRLASTAIFIGTASAVATLSFWLYVGEMVFG